MTILRDVYLRHLDTMSHIGYESKHVVVPFYGHIVQFGFDENSEGTSGPKSALRRKEVLNEIRQAKVEITMPLKTAWETFKGMREARYSAGPIYFETSFRHPYKFIDQPGVEKVNRTKSTHRTNIKTMDKLVSQWLKMADKLPEDLLTSHNRAIMAIWLGYRQEQSSLRISPFVFTTREFMYNYKQTIKGTEKEVEDCIGALEHAIMEATE